MRVEEVIFIGAGPGTAMAAKKLSESGVPVLILEEGSIPNTEIRHHSLEEILKYYRHGGIRPAIGKVPINLVDVSVLGGGSVVNSGIYHDIPNNILQSVEILGEESQTLSFQTISKYVKDTLRVCETPSSNFGDRLTAAAGSLNLQSRILPRWSSSVKSLTGWQHTHYSVYDTILKPLQVTGLRIHSQYRVLSIKKKSGLWTVACLNLKTNIKEEFKSKIVVLGAGSLRTPMLLRQSNLSKNAGDVLRFHPMKRIIFAYPKNSYDFLGAVLPFQITHFLPKITIGCSLSDPGSILFWHPDIAKKQLLADYDLVSHYVLAVPQNPARIKFFAGKSQIFHKFTNRDINNLALGYTQLLQISRNAGSLGQFHNGEVINPSSDFVESPKEAKFLYSGLSSIHQYGSCPFGSNPDDSVIDYNFQVWGHSGLYICDSSVIPHPVGVNPQGTICALSFIFASRLLKSIC